MASHLLLVSNGTGVGLVDGAGATATMTVMALPPQLLLGGLAGLLNAGRANRCSLDGRVRTAYGGGTDREPFPVPLRWRNGAPNMSATIHHGYAFGWRQTGTVPATLPDGTVRSVKQYGVSVPDAIGAEAGDIVLAVTAERGNRGQSFTAQALTEPAVVETVTDATGMKVRVTLWKVERVPDAMLTASLLRSYMEAQG